MKRARVIFLMLSLLITTVAAGCTTPDEIISNPWLVPFRERQGSTVSRSQMRAMVRLGDFYRDAGMEHEYLMCLITGVELYAGDPEVTFELLNILIDGINRTRSELSVLRGELIEMGVEPSSLSEDNIRENGFRSDVVEEYVESREKLENQYEECYRIMKVACGQIPYNPVLYYRTASLQYLRATEDPNEESRRAKYKDAINYLKRAIASDSGHLESYHLIAKCYEALGDTERAARFWRLFDVVYSIAPEVMGRQFITPERERLHGEAVERLESIGSGVD